MAFHDVQFPPAISLGSLGGPERRTDIVTLASGHEERSTPWAHARRRFDAGVGLRSLDDLSELLNFFEARLGQLHTFRWKDWSDYKSCRPLQQVSALDQTQGYGDGQRSRFRLIKAYSSGPASYARPIALPVRASLRVAVAGNELLPMTDYIFENGDLVFAAPPASSAEVTAGFEFDIPVRFDTDTLQIAVSNFQAGEVPSVPVVEVKL